MSQHPGTGSSLLPFSILAPDLSRAEAKILDAMQQRVAIHGDVITELPGQPPAPAASCFMLSVGKAALDMWHHYGLIQVGAHHGCTFTPTVASRRLVVMQLQHPGTVLQRTLPGFRARDAMLDDLHVWRGVLAGAVDASHLRMEWCGKCTATRARAKSGVSPPRRRAVAWEDRLDGVGLCDDHWRTRAKIKRRDVVKRETNQSKPGAQIAGQMEMMPGDGQRVMVEKR